ncbi:MAG TPA: hypothetical protein QF468_03285 [Nitrospinota bacterium]|jgi:hypothetical protein|nr:hypothetical protein [Nitrospinota bacterium]
MDLALRYMQIFYSGKNIDRLYQLFSDDFSFSGPLFQFDSAKGYINSLINDPPEGLAYKIIQSFESESSACLVYKFSKPGISCVPMAQLFETEKDKIKKITLIFDTQSFT